LITFLVLGALVVSFPGCRQSAPAHAAPAAAVVQPTAPAPDAPIARESATPTPSVSAMRRAIEAIGTARKYSPQAEARLRAALTHFDQDVRGHACWGLGRLAPETVGSIPALIVALADPIWAVQHNARWALTRLGAAAADPLRAALADPALRRRVQAALTLGELDPSARTQCADVLVQAYAAADRQSKQAVLQGLGMSTTPSPSALKLLGDAVQSGDDQLLMAAVPSLGAVGPAAAPITPALVRVLQHKNKRIRMAVAGALGGIGVGSPEVVSALVRVLGDKKDRPAFAAAGALAKLQAIDALDDALRADSARVRANAAKALGDARTLTDRTISLLAGAVADPDADVRLVAVSALMAHAGPQLQAAAPALEKALTDDDESVRGHARLVLDKLRNPNPEQVAR